MYVANLEHVPPHEKCKLNIFKFLLIAFAVILTNVNGRSKQGTNSFVCNKMSELPKVINFKDLTSGNIKL